MGLCSIGHLTMILVLFFLLFELCNCSEGHWQADSEDYYDYCIYKSDIATGYGVGAFLFLMTSQVFVMVARKCFCCGNPLKPGGSRSCALLLFTICWVTFLIAEVCLLAASVKNAYHTKYRNKFFDNPPSCEAVRKGVFAAGAAFIFLTAVISEFFDASYSKARESFSSYAERGEAAICMAAYK